jgi:hypothetical protein
VIQLTKSAVIDLAAYGIRATRGHDDGCPAEGLVAVSSATRIEDRNTRPAFMSIIWPRLAHRPQ